MKLLHPIFLLSLFLCLSPLARAGFTLEGRCAGSEGRYVRDGRDGKDIKPALNAISAASGKNLRIYSCFRSQDRQNSILRSRGCAPFGSRDCSQSVARVSMHTRTIATDIRNFESDLTRQCQMIARGRAVAGGGGVGSYPGGDGHFDLGRTRSWNRCAGVVGASSDYRSPAAERYRQRSPASASRQCYPTRSYPSCCGPVRRSRGLCTG